MEDAWFGRERRKTMDRSRAQRLHQLLKRLGRAVHGSVVKSDEVRQCLQELHEEGWNAVMLLEASVTCRDEGVKRGPASLRIHVGQESSSPVKPETSDKVEYRINRQDASFLRSLGISPSRHHSTPSRGST